MIREPSYPGHHFIYNGFNSADFGVFISGVGTYDAPTREVETVSIPGRSGDILFDNNRFSNIDITYPCYIPRGFPNKYEDFKAAMLSDTGYHRLEDTYSPEHFREAYVTGPIAPGTGPVNKSGRFDITFHCKPQRFLTLGERALTLTDANSRIHNRTLYPSKPLIQITGTQGGSGFVYVSRYGASDLSEFFTIIINENTTGIMYLDCETCNAYYEVEGTLRKVSLNNKIQTDTSGFPVLAPGYNNVQFSGSITRLVVRPNWWTV